MDDKDLQDIIEAAEAEDSDIIELDTQDINKEVFEKEERIAKDSLKKDKTRRNEAEKDNREGKEDSDNDNSDPAPGEGLSEEVFEVENILEHAEDDGCTFYKVHWKGYGEEDDSWEPAENLGSASLAIEKYWKEVNEQKGKKKSKTKKTFVRKSKVRKQNVAARTPVVAHTKNSTASNVSRSRKIENQSYVSEKNENDSVMEISKNTKELPSRTLTKAALKAYDTPKKKSDKDKNSTLESMTLTKKFHTAIQLRQAWLLESDGDSEDSDNDKEMEENMKFEKENKADQEHDGKQRDKNEDKKREDRKRRAEKKEEKTKKKKSEHISELPVINGESSSAGDIIDNKDYTATVSGIAKVDGEIRVCIDIQGRRSVVTVKEAFTINAWALTDYLISRVQFE